MIASCSTLRIRPYLFYIEKFIIQFKTTEKTYRSPHSFSKFSNAHTLITWEIVHSRWCAMQYNIGEWPQNTDLVLVGVICPCLQTRIAFFIMEWSRSWEYFCVHNFYLSWPWNLLFCCLTHCRVQILAIHYCYHPSMASNTSVFCHSWRIY